MCVYWTMASSSSASAPSLLKDVQGTSESSELIRTRFANLFYIRMNNRLLPEHNRNALEHYRHFVENWGIA